jgi:hypothetical protein
MLLGEGASRVAWRAGASVGAHGLAGSDVLESDDGFGASVGSELAPSKCMDGGRQDDNRLQAPLWSMPLFSS